MLDLVITCTDATVGDTGSVSIEVSAPSVLVAPAQVWLKAVDHADLAAFEETGSSVYEGERHEYHHEWMVDGEPLANWTKPANLIAAHNNPNKAFGLEVAFSLTDPGDHVISLKVTDRNGKIATASTSTLTVITPEAHFPDARRIYVDLTGVHAGVPVGSTKVSTMDALKSAMDSKPTADDLWIRFKRGQVYDMSDYNVGGVLSVVGAFRLQRTTPCLYMSDWGDGGDARVKFLPATQLPHSSGSLFEFWDNCGSTFATATGLDFDGGWESDTELGDRGTDGGAFSTATSNVTNIHLNDINVNGIGKGFYTGTSPASRIMLSDCKITNWKDYGIFGGGEGNRLAYVGVSVVPDPQAPLGDGSAFNNYHAPVRVPSASMLYISGGDFYSRFGHDNSYQGTLRVLVSAAPGDAMTIERCAIEGGFECIQLMKKAGVAAMPQGLITEPGNFVVERNIITLSSGTAVGINCNRSSLTVRDNIFVGPNSLKTTAVGKGAILLQVTDLYTEYESADIPTDPIAIYGNTYINLADAAHDYNQTWPFVENDGGHFTNVTEENNVTHSPYLDTPSIAFAPIDMATAISGYTPHHLGKRVAFELVRDLSMGGDIADGESFTIPYASIHQNMQDGTVLTATMNQAYWTAISGTDTRHALKKQYMMYAEAGHFTVSFDPTGVTITNTSGLTWFDADEFQLALDRTSYVPAMVTTDYATDTVIPLPRPTTGSPAIGAATTGRVSPLDFLLTPRGSTPSKGALEPA